MSRRRRIWVVVLLVLAAVLAANTISVDNQTGSAHARDGGHVLRLSTADLNVAEEGNRKDPPIVLLHCYVCSIRWWQDVADRLARDHRVIRIDLLGHGGSEKPGSGYSIENQARLIAQAMNKLGVERATVAGQSLGGEVAGALAEQSSELVDRVAILDSAPTKALGKLPLPARLGHLPVLGEALNRITPDFAVRSQIGKAFAKGFKVPGYAVPDYRAMTYPSYKKAPALDDFLGERSLTQRLIGAGVPVMVLFGAEDRIIKPDRAIDDFRKVPGVEIHKIAGSGHTPQVEKPAQTARLIARFAAASAP